MTHPSTPLTFLFNPNPPHHAPHILFSSHQNLNALARGPILTSYSMYHDIFKKYPESMNVVRIGSSATENAPESDEEVFEAPILQDSHQLTLRHRMMRDSAGKEYKCLYCMENGSLYSLLRANRIGNLQHLRLEELQNVTLPHDNCVKYAAAEPVLAEKVDSILLEMQSDEKLFGAFLMRLSSNEVLVSQLSAHYTALCAQHIALHETTAKYRTSQWKFAQRNVHLVHEFHVVNDEKRAFPVKSFEEIVATERKGASHQTQEVQLVALMEDDFVMGALVAKDRNASDTTTQYLAWMQPAFASILQCAKEIARDSTSTQMSLPSTLFACALRSTRQSLLQQIHNPETSNTLPNFQFTFQRYLNLLCTMMDKNKQCRRCVLKSNGVTFVAYRFSLLGHSVKVSDRDSHDDLYILATSEPSSRLEAQIRDLFL